jgi:uncharacterized Zn finger protein (UPF0148 family)
MRACPSCGFPLDRRNLPAVCPKCDEDLVRAKARKPLIVDLAHRGETVSQALAKLDKAMSECVWHCHPSLKVIHGHGSGDAASRIKPQVLAALRKHAERLGAVMEQDGDNPRAHVLRFR